MAVDYSAYKLATASSVMSASNWNAFWALNLANGVGINPGYLYNIAVAHSLDAKDTVPDASVSADGSALEATKWNAIIQWLLEMADEYSTEVCHPVYVIQLDDAIDALGNSAAYNKSSGDSITTTIWNTLLDHIKAIVDIIALSEDVWTFGSAMPIVLV